MALICYCEIDLNQDRRLNGIEMSSTKIDWKWMNDMKAVDKNRDGEISRQELKIHLKKETLSSSKVKRMRLLL